MKMKEKTRKFRDLLQENIQDALGVEVPVETCWVLYKTIIATNLQFLLSLVDTSRYEDVKLPLRGVGTWKIEFRKPRSQSWLVGKVDWVPHFRFSPSTRFRRVLLKNLFGVEEPVPISAKRRKELASQKRSTGSSR